MRPIPERVSEEDLVEPGAGHVVNGSRGRRVLDGGSSGAPTFPQSVSDARVANRNRNGRPVADYRVEPLVIPPKLMTFEGISTDVRFGIVLGSSGIFSAESWYFSIRKSSSKVWHHSSIHSKGEV